MTTIDGDCLRWSGYINPSTGYGQISLPTVLQGLLGGRVTTAPRVSLWLDSGELPNGRYVLHSCDNNWCCRPSHLRWGSPKENMDDRMNRNPKSIWGEGHPGSLHSSETVAEARRLDKSMSVPAISRLLGVKYHTVYAWLRKGARPNG